MVMLEGMQETFKNSMGVEEGFEFCTALNMAIKNAIFKKKASHIINFEPGPSKTRVNYGLVKRNQTKFLKDTKVLPRKECITYHKPF